MARARAAALAAFAGLALAACGGGEPEPERRSEPPRIPSAVADELAERSDAVADKISAGDLCGAAHEADALEDRAEELIAAGEIPRRYRAELRSEAVWLRDRVNCPPPPPPQEDEKEDEEEKKDEKDEDDNKGKGNGKGEGEGNGNGEGDGDGLGLTVTLDEDG
ncbi:MAG TPA: hypothetical protein VG079_07355 [Gaiellaceae bacterium]|nr:hypothetical protein [Gaiellaceae bacterium]